MGLTAHDHGKREGCVPPPVHSVHASLHVQRCQIHAVVSIALHAHFQIYLNEIALQWTLANPNSLGPEPIQISEIFGLVKATAATCVIVTAPYLHSVLGSLGSLSLLHVQTLLPNNLLALCCYTSRKT